MVSELGYDFTGAAGGRRFELLAIERRYVTGIHRTKNMVSSIRRFDAANLTSLDHAVHTASVLAALVVFSTQSASATPVNLVQDPGFETAGPSTLFYFAPSYLNDGVWQQTLGAGELVNIEAIAHTGNSAYRPRRFDSSDGTIEQSLLTLPGQSYDLTFFDAYIGSGLLQVSFGGAAMAVVFTSPMADGSYQLGTATNLVATGSQTKLDFRSLDGTLYIDDVSVTASVATTVSEPFGIFVAASGLLALFGIRRHRA